MLRFAPWDLAVLPVALRQWCCEPEASVRETTARTARHLCCDIRARDIRALPCSRLPCRDTSVLRHIRATRAATQCRESLRHRHPCGRRGRQSASDDAGDGRCWRDGVGDGPTADLWASEARARMRAGRGVDSWACTVDPSTLWPSRPGIEPGALVVARGIHSATRRARKVNGGA